MELPDVETSHAASGKKFILPIVIVALLLIAGFLLFNVLVGNSAGGKSSNKTADGTVNTGDYIDFAENLAIALNNISYMNQSEQRADLADYMADDLLTSYQKYFYDPDFQRLVADRKIYITFQKIQRSTVETQVGSAVAVKVIGYNTYRSEISQTQLEVPFTLFLQIEKRPDGRLVATKLKKI